MKKQIQIAIFLFCSGIASGLFAQEVRHHFLIRNYSRSLFLQQTGGSEISVFYSMYGELSLQNHTNESAIPYLFTGQEFDRELNLYYFPSRLYELTSRRFLQTDPKSQYHSPYLYVGGDPVNRIDLTGNEGKPLILYGEDHDFADLKDPALHDLQGAVGDEAYYVPLSDFVNGEVGDLPEWNGNVYLEAHMGTARGAEIEVESSAPEKGVLKTKSYSNTRQFAADEFGTDIDARRFGAHLNRFAEERGVPLRSVVAGGCEGSRAAEGISQGVRESATKVAGDFRVAGLREGHELNIFGPKSSAATGKDGMAMRKTKIYAIGENSRSVRYASLSEKMKGKGKTLTGLRNKVSATELEDFPMMKGKQIREFVNGRIPSKFMPVMAIY